MSRFQAGYFVEAILRELANENIQSQIGKILLNLSHFEMESNSDLEIKKPDCIAIVVNNLISRGLPTLPSTFIEDRIANTFIKTNKTSSDSQFSYRFTNDELQEEILRALHIIEPRLNKDHIPKDFYSSKKNTVRLLKEFIPITIGDFYLQLLTKHRKILNIFDNSKLDFNINTIKNELSDDDFFDFSIELPYLINSKAGIGINIIENNEVNTDFKHAEFLSDSLKSVNWCSNAKIKDINFEQPDEELQKVVDFTFNEYFDTLRKNYTSPLYRNEYGLNALQIALTPLAIARVQKAIVTHILSGDLNLKSSDWKIAVVERDVPAAFLAIEDLNNTFNKPCAVFINKGTQGISFLIMVMAYQHF